MTVNNEKYEDGRLRFNNLLNYGEVFSMKHSIGNPGFHLGSNTSV